MAILGDGVKIGYCTTSPVSWTELVGLVDLPAPPGPVAEMLENTTHGTSGYKTYGAGLKDVPDVTATFHFTGTAAQLAMISAQAAGTVLWFRFEVPATAAKTTFRAWEMQAVVIAAPVATPIADWQTLTLTLKYSGNFAFYPDAAATAIT